MTTEAMTNVEFVTELMEDSKFGALAQLFVVDAIAKVAKRVADASPSELQAMEGGSISPNAWHGVAREIAEKMEGRY